MGEGEKAGEEKGAGPAFSTNQWIVVGFLFVLFFVLLKVLNVLRDAASSIPVLNLFFLIPDPFQSPMFFAMPIVSFFIIFFIIDWANRYFATKHALHPAFILLFFFLSFFAFYVALFWYHTDFTRDSNVKLLICVSDEIGGPFGKCSDIANALIKEGTFNQYIFINFWERLHANAFMLFIWGGVFGWITRFAVEKIKL